MDLQRTGKQQLHQHVCSMIVHLYADHPGRFFLLSEVEVSKCTQTDTQHGRCRDSYSILYLGVLAGPCPLAPAHVSQSELALPAQQRLCQLSGGPHRDGVTRTPLNHLIRHLSSCRAQQWSSTHTLSVPSLHQYIERVPGQLLQMHQHKHLTPLHNVLKRGWQACMAYPPTCLFIVHLAI
jgi:hypothetical protein